MASISNLGYYVLGVSDLEAWEAFAVDVIGLQVSRRCVDGSIALRMDGYEQRMVLEASTEDDVMAVGWELSTELELEEFVAQVVQQGVSVSEGDVELASKRRVEKVYYCVDPNGMRHEFYAGAECANLQDTFKSKVLLGSFCTGRLGVGHFVAVAKNKPETVDFCKRILGIKVSDYIRGELAPGKLLDVTFFHARTGRHHSVAVAELPFPYPKRVHHIMVETTDMNDVGLAFDRCVKAGYDINMGLGSHPNDKMFSFYVRTPSGFLLEFGCGGIVIDDATWEVKAFKELSTWGHHHPEPKAPVAA
jgi:2,3-dihydroxybiphenyl 1,2-dioxygenase